MTFIFFIAILSISSNSLGSNKKPLTFINNDNSYSSYHARMSSILINAIKDFISGANCSLVISILESIVNELLKILV